MSVINKHRNYLYDLKMCDADYQYVKDLTLRQSRLSDILSCNKPDRINGFSPYIYLAVKNLGVFFDKYPNIVEYQYSELFIIFLRIILNQFLLHRRNTFYSGP
jgi:hypothetical protein